MQIIKIFNSIESTGLHVGYLTTYINVYGCNLSCGDCVDRCIDTIYNKEYSAMEVHEIVDKIIELGNIHVTICGGEPLLQKDMPELVGSLLDGGHLVNIETQGAVDLRTFENNLVDLLNDDETLKNLTYSVDYKCPSSGYNELMNTDNLTFMIENDVLKFNISNLADLECMKTIVETELLAEVFAIPYNINPIEIIEYINTNNLQKVRIQLPLRKEIF